MINNRHKYTLYVLYLLFATFSVATEYKVNPKTCNVLALSGGGAYVSVEAGMLYTLNSNTNTITANFPYKLPSHFDVISGISAGGLAVGFLEQHKHEPFQTQIDSLITILNQIKFNDVYKFHIDTLFDKWGLLDTSPLRETIEKHMLTTFVTSESSTTYLIGTTNLQRQAIDVFNMNNYDINDKIDIMMATCAIPFLFPPHVINGTYYLDGGVIDNELIIQSLERLKCDKYNVYFLNSYNKRDSIATPRNILEYSIDIAETLIDTFNYQMAMFKDLSCDATNVTKNMSNVKGKLIFCEPSVGSMNGYNLLDFDKSSELVEIGKKYIQCNESLLCF